MEKIEVAFQKFENWKFKLWIYALIALVGSYIFIHNSWMVGILDTEDYILSFKNSLDTSAIFKNNIFPFSQIIAHLESSLFERNILYYRNFHLIVHVLTTLLMSFALKKMNFKYAWAIGLLFLIHPFHGSLIYIFSRFSAVYATLFGVLSFNLFYQQGKTDKTYNKFFISSLVFYYLSIQTHYLFLTMPLFILLNNLEYKKLESWKSKSSLLPFFVFFIVKFIELFKGAADQFATGDANIFKLELYNLMSIRLTHIFELVIAPNAISPLYSFSLYNFFSLVAALVFFSVLLANTVFLKEKISKVSLGLLIFFIPVSGVFNIKNYQLTPFGDENYYLLTFLFIIFLLHVFDKLLDKKSFYISLFIPIVAVILVLINFKSIGSYYDSETFYEGVRKKSPELYIGHIDAALVMEERKKYRDALDVINTSEAYWVYFPLNKLEKAKVIQSRLSRIVKEDIEKKKGESPRP